MNKDEERKALIETKWIRREFINKMLVFGTIAITVIIFSSIAGIIVANSYNKKLYTEYTELEEEQKEVQEDNVQEENTTLLPIYSEEAQDKINNIYKTGEGEEKVAYLTFDDGPSQNITPQILQILQEEGIKATFFVLGSRVEKYPELVKQEYEAGHYIANHGYSHDYSSIYVSENTVLDEYNRTEELIKSAIGNQEYSSHLFRFPGGSEGGNYSDIKNAAKNILIQNRSSICKLECFNK